MTTALAVGTFDILHPGHRHYLEQAAERGDELVVVVARRPNISHKESPLVPAAQRRDLVEGLEPVDRAVLGHPDDVYVPIREIDPDVIVLGYDQHHDEDALEAALAGEGIDCSVERASAYEPAYDGAVLSSSTIVERILDQRHDQAIARTRPPSIENPFM